VTEPGRGTSPFDDFTDAEKAEAVEWAEAGLPLYNEATEGRSSSPDDQAWEDMLADPAFQTPHSTELLPHLLASDPPVEIEVRRCCCAAVHIGRCNAETTPAREPS
jgi:hypothetical protein